ncbi:MAG: hypothetical protein JXP34_28160 [Planctomycetes bacterium]|nr:hypothetical protein [Planctomycetota bacterium]
MMGTRPSSRPIVLAIGFILAAGCGVEPGEEDDPTALARAKDALGEWKVDWRVFLPESIDDIEDAFPASPPTSPDLLEARSDGREVPYRIEDALAVRRVAGVLRVQTSACAPSPSEDKAREIPVSVTLPLLIDDAGQFRIRLPLRVRAIDFDGHALLAIVRESRLAGLGRTGGPSVEYGLLKESLIVIGLNRPGGRGAHFHNLNLLSGGEGKSVGGIIGGPDYLVGEAYDLIFGIAGDRAFCRLESRGGIGRANCPALVIPANPARSEGEAAHRLIVGGISGKSFTMVEIGPPSFFGCRLDDTKAMDPLHEARDAFAADRYVDALSLFARCEGLSSQDEIARHVARIRAEGDGDWTAIERAQSSAKYCDALFFLRLERMVAHRDWPTLFSFCESYAGDGDSFTHAHFLRGFARTLPPEVGDRCLDVLERSRG